MLVGGTARKTIVAKRIRECGCTMFLQLFKSFESTYHRQEIKRAKESIEYHTKKLNAANLKARDK